MTGRDLVEIQEVAHLGAASRWFAPWNCSQIPMTIHSLKIILMTDSSFVLDYIKCVTYPIFFCGNQ